MPVSVEIVGPEAKPELFKEVFDYFRQVDKRYSTYKEDSEISRINHGLPRKEWTAEMVNVMALCEETKRQTGGFFNIEKDGELDPSGLVKGWSIRGAANLLIKRGVKNFMIEAGGDIQTSGLDKNGQTWRVGIRDPFNRHQNVKVLKIDGQGVATSGAYIRGQHIYNPHDADDQLQAIASLTVVGPDIYEADRMATAAFAMGRSGINFIEKLSGFEGYSIDQNGMATMTSGFEAFAL